MAASMKDYEAVARILGEEMAMAAATGDGVRGLNMAANRIGNWFGSKNPRFNEGTFFGRIAAIRNETAKMINNGDIKVDS